MKKILCTVTLLSMSLFAQEVESTNLSNSEKEIVKQSVTEMKKMDKVDKKIRILDASIEKKKLSIYKTFKEIAEIVNGYECKTFKVAVSEFKLDLDFPENLSKEELIEKRIILKKLKTKLKSKCQG